MNVVLRLAGGLGLLLLAGAPAGARDWRWYPERQAPDANALRPDLEGTKGDDRPLGMSELDEMRQWLYRRDVERRERGFTLPDTVEQLTPGEAEQRTDPRSGSATRAPARQEDGFRRAEPQGRVRNVFSSEPARERSTDGLGVDSAASPEEQLPDADADDAAPQRHAHSGKHRRKAKSTRRSHGRSAKAAKHRSGKRRR